MLRSVTPSKERVPRRSRVELPAQTVAAFRAGARQAGVPGSTLMHGWLTTAARYAREGNLDLVPSRSVSPTTSGDQDRIEYPMTATESTAIAAALRDVGSSTRAVAAACIEAFLEADASAARMVWPRRVSSLAA